MQQMINMGYNFKILSRKRHLYNWHRYRKADVRDGRRMPQDPNDRPDTAQDRDRQALDEMELQRQLDALVHAQLPSANDIRLAAHVHAFLQRWTQILPPAPDARGQGHEAQRPLLLEQHETRGMVQRIKKLDPLQNADDPEILARLNDQTRHPFHLAHRPDGDLNAVQQVAFQYIQAFVDDRLAGRHPAPVYLFLSGGPGTGKTHWSKLMRHYANSRGMAVVCSSAYGSAAANMPGMTIHSLFQISCNKSQNAPLNDVMAHKMVGLRAFFQHVGILLIDEISVCSPALLFLVNLRLQQIKGNRLPFGGLSVVLMGDFHQLKKTGPPGFARLVAKEAEILCRARNDADRDRRLQRLRNTAVLAPGTNNARSGMVLYTKFVRIELLRQERAAGDGGHTTVINGWRNETQRVPLFPPRYMDLYPEITRQDFEQDPGWYEAPLLVTTNAVRHAVNDFRSQHLAQRKGFCVIKWRERLSGRAWERIEHRDATRPRGTPSLVNKVYEDNLALIGSFVQGMPAMVLANISPCAGLANGTCASRIMTRLWMLK
jgi:hypothetical protein